MSRSQSEKKLTRMRRRALLVGIRTYPEIPGAYGQPLAGCHNDVADLRRVLLSRGFDDSDLVVLVDTLKGCGCAFCGQAPERQVGSPTRDGIVDAMDRLLAATDPGDVVVFYYSGHGSEFSARGRFTGRRHQTFVPHDSGRGRAQNRDVTDLDIEIWTRQMAAVTPYLTLIFDCCHSGGVADLRGDATVARQVVADERQESTAYAPALRRQLDREAPSRGGERSSAIVLSACVAEELSSETVVDGRRQGLFTHHLTRVLGRPPVAGQTWADVFPEIAAGVTNEDLAQHPRRGGNGPIFEPGPIDTEDVDPPDVIELAKLAVVIGIDYRYPEGGQTGRYPEGGQMGHFPPLLTPQRDAEEVARVLAEDQGYEIVGLNDRSPGPLLGEKATRRRIHKVLHRLAAVKARIRRETAVVIYFAGHGVTRAGDGEHQGSPGGGQMRGSPGGGQMRGSPGGGQMKGYLVPWEADPQDPSTWLSMRDLRDQLVDGIDDQARIESLEQRGPLKRLTSRHLLLVLDCCYGGALAYDFFRGGDDHDRPIYYSEYKRFVEGTAWHLLASASFNQQALDRDPDNPRQPFSPFAQAVIEGLTSDLADVRSPSSGGTGRGDHIITAGELHQHVDRRLRSMGVDIQTPGLVDLRPGDGQFIFSVPGFAPSPLPDPSLHPDANPWRGPRSYGKGAGENGTGEGDAAGPEPNDELFCGREQATLDLLASFLACRHPAASAAMGTDAVVRRSALAVAGGSGSGVTSLLRAGLLPLLADPVAARRRLRSWSRRGGHDHYLVAREDLQSLRAWVGELALAGELASGDDDAQASTTTAGKRLAGRIRTWAVDAGLLDDRGSAAAGHNAAGRSRIVRQSLGLPSFDPDARDDRQLGWPRRVGLLSLLDRPALLADRLRLWSRKKGLADFLSYPDRALAGLVGRWRVAAGNQPPIESGDGTNDGLRGNTLWLCDPLEEPAGTIEPGDWRSLIAGQDLQIVAAVRADSLVRDPAVAALLADRAPDAPNRWRLHRVAGPTREELWQVVQGPAAAQVLFFEPEGLADILIEEAARAPAPLPLLSMALAHMVERAWQRRGAADRRLVAADLAARPAAGAEARTAAAYAEVPVAPIAELLAHRAEALYRDASGRGPARRRIFRMLVLRAVSVDEQRVIPRAVRWRELELADAAEGRRLGHRVLPALIDGRLVVAGDQQVELASGGLLAAWPRLRRWLRYLEHIGVRPQALWHRALEWQASDFDPGKLPVGDRDLPRLLSAVTLNRLELTFVAAGEVARRTIAAETLAALALRDPGADWTRSALLAAELAEHARDTTALIERLSARLDQATKTETAGDALSVASRPLESFRQIAEEGRESCRQLAEQTLHDVLAATPLSLPLALPPGAEGRLEGLCFDGRRKVLSARIGSNRYSWSLEDPAALPRQAESAGRPRAGEGEVRPRRLYLVGPEEPFPAVPPVRPPIPPRGPHAQTGHDRTIRYFAPGQLLPPPPLQRPPVRLLGHRGVPTFLAFSPREKLDQHPRWLVSGANTGQKPELRLWPIDGDGTIPGEPRSNPEADFDQADDRTSCVRRLDRLPVTLTAGGCSWLLESVAEDGASIELSRPGWPEDGVSLELPAAAHDKTIATVPAADAWSARLPPLPRLQALLARLPQPRVIGTAGLREIRLGPRGHWLAVITRRGWAGMWSLPDRDPRWSSADRVATLAWGPAAERHPGHRLLAVGHLDGTVRLWRCRSEAEDDLPLPVGRPVVLRAVGDGFAVRSLAFGSRGRRLAVERRGIYEPFDRRLDVYRLDARELAALARRHAGRNLEPEDLPPAPRGAVEER